MTTPEIPEAAEEAAARAVWEDYRRPVNARLRARVGGHRGRVPELPPWESLPEDHVPGSELPNRAHFRAQVRPALQAALPYFSR